MTKSRSIRILAAALVAAFVATPATAKPERAPADVQKRYDQFITGFRAALKANDAAAVASMTAFPFYWNGMRDGAYFQKVVYPKAFPRKVRDCIARGRSFYDRYDTGKDAFTIFCGEQLFVFTGDADGFRFTDIGVND
jgi:hypothetical protein